jgi:membrane protease YdiL (CAAX protease family)
MLLSVPAYLVMMQVMLDSRDLKWRESFAIHGFRFTRLVASVAFLIGAMGITALLILLTGYDKEPEFPIKVLETRGSWLVLFVGMCVVPGIVEELVFRGVMFTGLRKKFGPVVVILITSALFGIIHLQYDWFGIVAVSLLGVALGVTREFTGSVIPCMIIHALNNAYAFISVAIDEGML